MSLTKIVFAILILAAAVGAYEWKKRRRNQLFLQSHSVDAEQLHALLFGKQTSSVQVVDVRQPLDLLAYSEIIPGSRRIPPKDILENPELLPRDRPAIVYCTCPSDETAIKIMQRAVSLGFDDVRILRGGLGAWKEKSYPVEPYESAFQLDTPTQ